jgi:hypothetical protein
MTGGLMQLAAYGAQDLVLTGNPQITFFTAVYRRYTNFAIQNIKQYFNGNADFGQKFYCKIDTIGDLMYKTYLRINLPSLKPYAYTDDTGNQVKFYWVNSIGHAIIKNIEVEIGGVVVDRHYGLWLDIWGELTIGVNQRPGYYSMIGKSETPVNYNNDNALELYVPLQFWFNRFIGQSLPLIALQEHEVRINVTFRELQQCIISSNGEPFEPQQISGRNPGVPASLSVSESYLEINYIFLEDEERQKFAKNNHQYLIEQLQVYSTSLTSRGLRPDPTNQSRETRIPELFHRVILNFNHPVKELIWVLQNQTVLSLYPYGGNEWFNYSTTSYRDIDNGNVEPMTNAKIVFNGNDRLEYRSAKYYRTVVPFECHTNTPNNFIYVYSFSNQPEQYQPSGSCNFSRIDDQEIYMNISDKLIDPIINVFATNYNILNIAGGMAGVEYSS